MVLKLQQIGNSFMITIPREIVKKASLKKGDALRVEYKDQKVVIGKTHTGNKSIIALKGMIRIPEFNFNESIRFIKEDQYER